MFKHPTSKHAHGRTFQQAIKNTYLRKYDSVIKIKILVELVEFCYANCVKICGRMEG